jgi:hypothetical protein
MSDSIIARRRPPRNEVPVKIRFVLLWLAVGIPLLWGVMKTLQNALKLFQ